MSYKRRLTEAAKAYQKAREEEGTRVSIIEAVKAVKDEVPEKENGEATFSESRAGQSAGSVFWEDGVQKRRGPDGRLWVREDRGHGWHPA